MTGEQNPEPTNGDQNPTPNPDPTPNPGETGGDDVLDKFKKIKENYESKLTDKDKEIEELKEQLKAKESEVNNTIDDLNDEVNEKLEQVEKMNELQATVNELLKDKAEATVDKFIQEGKIAPAQRDTALKLCLSDNDTFLELYENAKPIVETQQKRQSLPLGTAERIANYFKN